MILQSLIHNAFFIVAGLAGINFVVGFHELGHFLFCKLFHVRTPTFSIGFGSFLISKKIGQTTFAFSSIPLGGYVEIAGSAEMGQGEQKDAHARDKHSFAVKPYWQKLLVMLGGIIFNLMFAYFALSLLFLIGLPKSELLYPHNAVPTVASVQPESPAQKFGIQVGDHIKAINDLDVRNDTLAVLKQIGAHAGKEITLLIERNGKEISLPVVLENPENAQTKGLLGVSFEITGTQGLGLMDAIKQGIYLTNAYILGTIKAFKNIFAKRDVSKLGGPVAVISQTVAAASHSFIVFIFFLAILSINLAIFNLIPLPILDGGQILHYTIEAIIGRPINEKAREYIHIASWLLILGLIAYLSAQDIYKLIKPFLAKLTGN